MAITLADAEKILDAARQKAASLGVVVTVAVVDDGSHLVTLSRMDGASPISPAIAEGKAVAAAMFQRDGAGLLSTANDRPAFFNAVKGMARGPMVPGPGSVPIRRGGAVIGAIGVSGARPEDDQQCAEAGAASVA